MLTDDRTRTRQPDRDSGRDPGRPAIWRAWSPAQVIAAAVGVFYVVIGAVALARTGMGDLTGPEAQVLGFAHTPLLAIIEIVFGVLVLSAAAGPWDAVGTLTGTGIVALVFGIIFLIETTGFHDALAVEGRHGWFYLTTGLIAIFTGGVAPIIWRRS